MNLLARKLDHFADLGVKDKQLLDELIKGTRRVAARRDIIKEGERPNSVHLILSGFACRYKITADGTRQIVALLLPGDFCDLHVAILGEMDHSIGTLSNCSAVANSVNRFRRSCLAAPRGGGAAVDVGPDLLGVGARAVVLARSAQFPRWEYRIHRELLVRDTSKNTSKADRCNGLLLAFSTPRDNCPEKSGMEPVA